ncbi:MAG: cytochrome c, class [Candidatus Solibacter sp.]|jgi:mono/diheme cytochrome c family protein|nr:cytochrome c, class [Candidatus Solibacter sp.]
MRIAIFLTALALRSATAQSQGTAGLITGKEIFEAGCAGCHGGDGKGAPQSTIGFETPDTFPDFTNCSQTTPEDNLAWKSVIRDGGPSRGFSQIMPSFSGALTPAQIEAVVAYVRGFCKGRGWPRGELNLPRAIATEKAFPEDEVVITTTLNANGAPGVTSEIIHEQRFGTRNQIEISAPVDFQRPAPGRWYGGLDQLGIGLKRVLLASDNSILSAQGEVILPTGNPAHGLGTGVTTFETFAAFGQLFPHYTFLQIQGGADLPVDTSRAPQSVFFRSAFGKSFAQNGGLGRLWSPMIEWLGTRDLGTGAKNDWDVMPEFQVTISKRQHVRFGAGLRIPATNTTGRQKQVMFYLLWDWQDGKLLEGWK